MPQQGQGPMTPWELRKNAAILQLERRLTKEGPQSPLRGIENLLGRTPGSLAPGATPPPPPSSSAAAAALTPLPRGVLHAPPGDLLLDEPLLGVTPRDFVRPGAIRASPLPESYAPGAGFEPQKHMDAAACRLAPTLTHQEREVARAVERSRSRPQAWERDRSAALLKLESDRERMEAAVEAARRREAEAKLGADAREARAEEEAEAAAAQMAEEGRRLRMQMAEALRRLRTERMMRRALSAFVRAAREGTQRRSLAAAELRWRRRRLGRAFGSWSDEAQRSRALNVAGERLEQRLGLRLLGAALLAWGAQAAAGGALRAHEQELRARIGRLLLRRAFEGWLEGHLHRAAIKRRLLSVLAMWNKRSLIHAWRIWEDLLNEAAALRWKMSLRAQRRTMLGALVGWRWVAEVARSHGALLHRIAASRLRRMLRAWSAEAERSTRLKIAVLRLQGFWSHREMHEVLQNWRQHSLQCRVLRKLGYNIHGRHTLAMKRWALDSLVRNWRAGRMFKAAQQRGFARVVAAWQEETRRSRRAESLLRARDEARRAGLVGCCFLAWHQLAQEQKCTEALKRASSMETQVVDLSRDRADAEAKWRSALDAARVHEAAAAELQHEAYRNAVLSASAGIFGTDLRWRVLPRGGPSEQAPVMRHRHAGLRLQLPGPSIDGPGGPEAMVVYGGCSANDWLSDVWLFTMRDEEEGAPSEVAAAWHAPSGVAGAPPQPRKDHAAVVVGQGRFLIVGGFNGTEELCDLHVATILPHFEASFGAAEAAEPGSDDAGGASPAKPSCNAKAQVGAPALHSWTVSWRKEHPVTRSPPGRSQHSAAFDAESGTALVFGGYSAGHYGLLNDLWAYTLEAEQWWGPSTTGVPPCPRRGHFSVVVGRTLYVGLGAAAEGRHLCDLHAVGLDEWHWEELPALGLAPSPRRQAAVEVVEGRWIVVHGGFDGGGFAADAFAFDTATRVWSRLEVSGTPNTLPAARANHTLARMGARLVLFGGYGTTGDLPGLHYAENAAVVEGLRLRRRAIAAEGRLRGAEAEVFRGREQMATVSQAARQAEELRRRAARLAAEHSQRLEDIKVLKSKLGAERERHADARSRLRAAEVQSSGLSRRLTKAQEASAAAREDDARRDELLGCANEEALVLREALGKKTEEAEELRGLLGAQATETAELRARVEGADVSARGARLAADASKEELQTAIQRIQAAASLEAESLRSRLSTALGDLGASEQKAAAAERRAEAAAERGQQQQNSSYVATSPSRAAMQLVSRGPAATELQKLATKVEKAEDQTMALRAEGERSRAEIGELRRRCSELERDCDHAKSLRDGALQQLRSTEAALAGQIEGLEAELRRERLRRHYEYENSSAAPDDDLPVADARGHHTPRSPRPSATPTIAGDGSP